jgi:O-antigen ligase
MINRFFTFNQTATYWLIIVACLCTLLPTAFMTVTTGLMVLAWLLSGDYQAKFSRIKNNPAALATIALFALYATGTLYSSANWDYSLKFLMKYQKLLFIPLIISVITTEKHREFAINTFLYGAIAVLVISWLMWLGIVPHHADMEQGYYVFKGRIAHNIFMSFALYLMLHKALAASEKTRITWVILAIFACLNILFLVNGRTGQITTTVLISLFIVETWGIKKLSYCLAAGLLIMITLQFTHELPHSRYTDFRQETEGGITTSAGARLAMYKSTLTLIKRHPVFGGGTGSLENEYKTFITQTKESLDRLPNPHNQFLLTTQELGVAGLALLLTMWILHWKASYTINNLKHARALRAIVLTITIGSLFNSLLLDASEGKFYCIIAGVLLSGYQPNRQEYKNFS